MSEVEPCQEEQGMNIEKERACEREQGQVPEQKRVPNPEEEHEIELSLAQEPRPGVEHDQAQEHGAEEVRQLKTASGACFFDRKRLGGRDIRLSKVIRLGECEGLALGDLVVSVYPSTLFSGGRARGTSFSAANGVGLIQVKCNHPVDADLSVSVEVGIGAQPRFVEHNFMQNPLLKVPGEWNFKEAISSDAKLTEVTVTVSIRPKGFPRDSAANVSAHSPAELHAASCTEPYPRHRSPTSLRMPDRIPDVTPETSPRSLIDPPVPATPPWLLLATSPAPVVLNDLNFLFEFTLRRADDVKLGLDITRLENENALLVEKVIAKGAMDAWNRLCTRGPSGGKAVAPGDKILSVNGKRNCTAMVEECRDKHLLKFIVRRGGPACDIPSAWLTGSANELSGGWGWQGRLEMETSLRPDWVIAGELASDTYLGKGSTA
jgi:hypothetical protein